MSFVSKTLIESENEYLFAPYSVFKLVHRSSGVRSSVTHTNSLSALHGTTKKRTSICRWRTGIEVFSIASICMIIWNWYQFHIWNSCDELIFCYYFYLIILLTICVKYCFLNAYDKYVQPPVSLILISNVSEIISIVSLMSEIIFPGVRYSSW